MASDGKGFFDEDGVSSDELAKRRQAMVTAPFKAVGNWLSGTADDAGQMLQAKIENPELGQADENIANYQKLKQKLGSM
jgi:hypothetical protein